MQTFFRDILTEVHQYYDALVAFFPRLMMGLLIIGITWFIARQIRNMADRRLKKQMEDPLLAEFLATMSRSVVFIIGLLFALKALGLGGITASILAGAGITAFIVGFALRDIGENFLAGILLAFKRPFRVGDFIETGATKGSVISLNIRDTHVKTPDGKDVYVPNAQFIKIPLINYTIDGFLRYDFVVGIPSSADYEKAMNDIALSVNTIEGVIRKRKQTEVFVSGIAPGRVDVTVSFWIDTFKIRTTADVIRSEVFKRVQAEVDKLTGETS